jgi:hypothetical protein
MMTTLLEPFNTAALRAELCGYINHLAPAKLAALKPLLGEMAFDDADDREWTPEVLAMLADEAAALKADPARGYSFAEIFPPQE